MLILIGLREVRRRRGRARRSERIDRGAEKAAGLKSTRPALQVFVSFGEEVVGDGFLPGAFAEGFGEFVLGEVDGLHHGLAEVGEGVGGFGFDMAQRDSGEEVAECGG